MLAGTAPFLEDEFAGVDVASCNHGHALAVSALDEEAALVLGHIRQGRFPHVTLHQVFYLSDIAVYQNHRVPVVARSCTLPERKVAKEGRAVVAMVRLEDEGGRRIVVDGGEVAVGRKRDVISAGSGVHVRRVTGARGGHFASRVFRFGRLCRFDSLSITGLGDGDVRCACLLLLRSGAQESASHRYCRDGRKVEAQEREREREIWEHRRLHRRKASTGCALCRSRSQRHHVGSDPDRDDCTCLDATSRCRLS